MTAKILIVEDEDDIRSYLAAALDDHGFQTVVLDETQDVVPAVRHNDPQLIILDIMMPLRSGISIFRELRQQSDLSAIPVVLMSGYSGKLDFMANEYQHLVPEIEIRAPEGFLEKPLDLQLLVQTIQSILEHKGAVS